MDDSNHPIIVQGPHKQYRVATTNQSGVLVMTSTNAYFGPITGKKVDLPIMHSLCGMVLYPLYNLKP